MLDWTIQLLGWIDRVIVSSKRPYHAQHLGGKGIPGKLIKLNIVTWIVLLISVDIIILIIIIIIKKTILVLSRKHSPPKNPAQIRNVLSHNSGYKVELFDNVIFKFYNPKKMWIISSRHHNQRYSLFNIFFL